MRIIFFGTPEFAVSSLKKLYDNSVDIAAVVTAPDRPSGRGLKMNATAIKKYALDQSIPVLQPEKLKDQLFLKQLKNFQADLFVVVAFRMLPSIVWQMPSRGTINLHASLLPNYRGAAPINWAIINGEEKTGVTTFFINDKIDTGDFLLKKEVEINIDDTAGSLHDTLEEIGSDLLLETCKQLKANQLDGKKQLLSGEEKLASKLNRVICQINWQKPITGIYNHIRGLSPYPAAWTTLKNKVCKIYEVGIELSQHSKISGTLITDNKSFIKVAVQGGYIDIKSLQLEGKKRLNTAEFLKGHVIESNEKIG